MTSPVSTAQSIEHLNDDCTCTTLDRDALCAMAEQVVGDAAFCRDLAITHPHLLSGQATFLSAAHAAQIQAIVTAIEQVAALPSYREAVLANAPQIARYAPGPIGIFMGYDFHLSDTGPRLIEINTNAGGALLNAYLLEAQRMCCAPMLATTRPAATNPIAIRAQFVADIQAEWTHQGRAGRPHSIAIVDETPREQYLYPEFVLFQHLFEDHGMSPAIADPRELVYRDGVLWHKALAIDVVYNRLTDFDFSTPRCQALREAYLAGDVVVTPNPHAHALYADKRNLTLLTDDGLLRTWGVGDATLATLRLGIPRTQRLTDANRDQLWAARKRLFFKPAGGYGGKATYRGDKITSKVWAEIANHDYVAQDLVTPSTRTIAIDGARQNLKADLRAYTYAGQVRLLAARLYQGQTTNFRTPGGGFAPVFVSDQSADCHCG